MTQLDFGLPKVGRQTKVVHLPKFRQAGLPVVSESSNEQLDLFGQEITVSVGVSAPDNTEETSGFEWTDDQVATLHEGLLYRSMELLRDTSTNSEDRAEILQWVYTPDLVRIERKTDGLLHQVRSVDEPFSFARCCALIGADADEIREALPRLLLECGIEVQFI